MEELSTLLVNYYDLNAKLIYGIKYFKKKEVSKDNVIRYCVHINNIGTLHNNIKKIKDSMGFPMFSFTDFKGDGFEIKDGFLHGDVSIARKYAQSLLSEEDFFKDENSLKNYELSLCINHLADKIKPDKTNSDISQNKVNIKEQDTPVNTDNKELDKKVKQPDTVHIASNKVLRNFSTAFNF